MSDDQVAEYARTAAGEVACVAPRGGVVAMRPLIVHASGKVTGRAPRRVLHWEYAASLDLGGGVRLALA